MKMITFDVSLPPSTNSIWRPIIKTFKGRRIPSLTHSPAYDKWIEKATLEVMAQKSGKGWKTITGPFMPIITMGEQLKGNKDIDNYTTKAIIDLCQRTGLVENDKLNDGGGYRWGDAPLGLRVRLVPIQTQPDR